MKYEHILRERAKRIINGIIRVHPTVNERSWKRDFKKLIDNKIVESFKFIDCGITGYLYQHLGCIEYKIKSEKTYTSEKFLFYPR